MQGLLSSFNSTQSLKAAAGWQLAGGDGGSTGQAAGQPEPAITEKALARLLSPARLR